MTTKRKVLVIGGGPAGLGAAIELLERDREHTEVHLVNLQDRLGGKASSWRDRDGYLIETGYHIFVGFYERLTALMKRAGIRRQDVVHPGGGHTYYYEPWSHRVHCIKSRMNVLAFAGQMLAYDGLPFWHRQSFNKFMASAYLEAFTGHDLTRHDDVCFSSFAVERGLRPEVLEYSIFRFFREAYFNWPEEVSAYAILQTLKYMRSARSGEILYPTASLTENLWAPLGRYFERLGGRIADRILLTGFVHDGRRVSGARVRARTLPAWLRRQAAYLGDDDRVLLQGYDEYICAVPAASFQRLNRGDERFWRIPLFRDARLLRNAVTLSLTAWTKTPVLARYPTSVTGLPAPLGIVADYKPHVGEWQRDDRFGSVLGFWGQERLFETWSDDRLVDRAFHELSRCLGVPDPRRAGLVHLQLHRNRAPSNQVWLPEPGTNRFRPGQRTPLRNLKLAGDWVRNDVDLLCMEAALDSGQQAARAVIADLARRGGYSGRRKETAVPAAM